MALALALAPWLQPGAQAGAQGKAGAGAAHGPSWQADPFALGVASGQPQPTSVVLWTRLHIHHTDEGHAAQPQQVVCELFADATMRQPLRQWRVATDAARAHSVHVLADGLQPGRHYWYRFVCGNASSAVGHTRTSPAPGDSAPRLRLALASCQHFEQGHFAAHRDIAQRDLDLVVFVGDYIYESTTSRQRLRQHVGGVPHDLAGYRARHAQYKSDPDLQACHAAHPWVMTWDDHEVVNDYADDVDRFYSDPAVFLQRRAAAYQAYFEHMPLRLGPQGGVLAAQMRIHDRMGWGQLADVWTLDCRQYRDRQACSDPLRGGGRMVLGCDALADPSRSMLGAAQERWLAQGLATGRARWQLLAQSTQMSPAGMDTPLGRTVFSDGWDGYPQARARLLAAVHQAGLHNVLVLGGDVHMNVAAQLRLAPDNPHSPIVASELVTTSISSRGLSAAVLAHIRRSNPDTLHARADERGYTLLEVSPLAAQAQFITTAHPVGPQARFGVQAQFEALAGVPGLHRA